VVFVFVHNIILLVSYHSLLSFDAVIHRLHIDVDHQNEFYYIYNRIDTDVSYIEIGRLLSWTTFGYT